MSDRDYWRERVRGLRQPRITEVKMGAHLEEGVTMKVTVPEFSCNW